MGIEAGSSTYYQAKRGIVQDNLRLLLDAGVKDSYISGDTWYDLSGNGNNATLYNTPTYSKTNGGRLYFDGVNEYAKVSGGFTYGQMTWALWIYKNTNNYRHLIYQGTTYGFVTSIYFYPAKPVFRIYSYPQGYSDVYGNSSLGNGQYYHIVATANNNNTDAMKLYINGVQQTQTASVINIGGAGDLWIAAYGYSGPQSFFGGGIHQLAVYNMELSAQQVLDNYNATRHRFGL